MSFFNRNNKITVRNDTFASTELMQRNIVRAIASIFLHLVRVDPKRTNQQRLHYLLNNLHRNFFQANRPYDELEQAIHNLMPIPDAVRIIQHEFSYAEKLIFLLQIIQLVFQEPEFNVLESLEIVELIDDLYIKLKDYDAMLDFVEGDTEHLCLCPALLLTDKITAFYNCLKLSPQPDADVKLADSFSEMLLIRLDESILVVSGSQQKLKINSQSVTEEIILSLKSGDTCEITSDKDNQQFCLDFEQIKVLFKNKLQNTRKSFNLQTETGLLRMMQTDNKLYCHSQTGRISIKNGIVYSKHQTELHLTDSFQTGNQSVTMLDILTQRFSPSVTDTTEKLFYLEKSDDVYTLSTSRNAHSLLSLQYKERNWYATPLNPFRKVFLNHNLLSDSTVYQTGTDVLDIDNDSLVINPSLEVTNTAKEIYNIEVKDIFHTYPDSDKHALNHIQFSLKRGDILAIMGPSGSGKTTLLKTFLGELHPKKAEIIIDGQDFISNREYFHSRIAYVPQDDLLFTNLTVYENLYYCVRLRLSGRYTKTALQEKIERILKLVGLYNKRHLRVGDTMDKKLSGGERKRLNIALELVSDPQIIIMDEPTSGLSSKDSEKLMQFLLTLKNQGKIILSTIHQPNPELFSNFSKLLLLDYGGTQVYFGDAAEVFSYFDDEYKQVLTSVQGLADRKKLKMPEYFFDILEAPSEHNPDERMFPPSYWDEKFKREKIVRIIQQQTELYVSAGDGDRVSHSKRKSTYRQQIHRLYWLLLRNFKNRLNSYSNLLVTFLGTPLLCLIAAVVLRFSPEGEAYQFALNENYSLYLFISVIIFIFLGMAGSIDEILAERRILMREAQLNIGMHCQLAVKIITLLFFTVLQVLEYYLFSSFVLKITGAFVPYLIYLILSGVIGFSFGLICSAIMKDRKAVINILPLVLIPQILFAGAVIPFDKMNPWLTINKKTEIPEFCALIPSRWLFEGFCTAQTDLNAWDRQIRYYNHKIKTTFNTEREHYIQAKDRFSASSLMSDYQNKELHKSVNMQTGKQYNTGKTVFLSRNVSFLGKNLPTWKRNLFVILLYTLLLQAWCLYLMNTFRRKQA